MPDEVSYSSALREMSTDLPGVGAADQRPHARVGAGDVGLRQLGREELVDGLQQVLEVLVGRLDVVEVGRVVVGVGRPDQRAAQPRQREDEAPAAGRDDRADVERQVLAAERDVRAARGADDRDLGLVVQLVGAQAVGPDAGGVDDVGGPDDERLAARVVAHAGRRARARPPRPGR